MRRDWSKAVDLLQDAILDLETAKQPCGVEYTFETWELDESAARERKAGWLRRDVLVPAWRWSWRFTKVEVEFVGQDAGVRYYGVSVAGWHRPVLELDLAAFRIRLKAQDVDAEMHASRSDEYEACVAMSEALGTSTTKLALRPVSDWKRIGGEGP